MLVSLLNSLLALVALVAAGYLLLLTLLSFGKRRSPLGSCTTRFAFVVPAHDEESSIASTVQSLLAVDYPPDRRVVLVVADNCSDGTAGAAQRAGARVLERHDPDRRGKGYPLALAFETLLAEGNVDAVVVVDADSTASPGMLTAFDGRIAAGARAVQARYGVRNPDASWRTRLMAIALGMFHDLRSLGRARLGVSCGLRGNGMCFTTELLHEHPQRAYGLVEDVEYGIALGLAGVAVAYAHEAEVLGEMASGPGAAAGQRQRWEGGRAAVRAQHLGSLLRRAPRSRIALDLALDLVIPPLSWIALLVAAGCGLEFVLGLCDAGPTGAVWLWLASAGGVAAYVARGVTLSGLGLRGFAVLAAAPAYIAWKVLRVSRRPAATWVRTAREERDA